MTESTEKIVRNVFTIILLLITAIVFNWAGYQQGIREERDRIMQDAVAIGVARWEVNQKNGKSHVVWCAGEFADKKEEKKDD